jgi:hypothetical protein
VLNAVLRGPDSPQIRLTKTGRPLLSASAEASSNRFGMNGVFRITETTSYETSITRGYRSSALPIAATPDLGVGRCHGHRQAADQQVQVRILPCWVHPI